MTRHRPGPDGGPTARTPDTPLGRLLRRRRRAVVDVAARRGARNVRVFGSVARGEDIPRSDVDLLVDLDEASGWWPCPRSNAELSDLLGTPSTSSRPTRSSAVRDEVLAEAISL